mmetsp:Transcript_31858/g.77216  ORF Transcript_31858/g.77216 Transcript_31858/m.77216 type:complete len:288 (-) Transcript_31858:209-1072(-)
MFFCNPFQQPTGRKEDDDGDNNRFRCLIDDINFSWRPSFDFGASINSSNNLRSRTASFSTGSVSTFDGAEDNNFVSNERFRDASSSDNNRQRISPLNTTTKGKKTRSTASQFQRSKLTRSSSKLMILLLCCCVILLGIRILGWHYDRMTTNDALESSMMIVMKDTIISSALRIWNGVVPSTSKLIEILGKIPSAISSLFRWDEVDDAIIDWIKRTIILVPQKILAVVTSTTTTTAIYDPATTLLPSMQTLMEHVSRLILRTIENFTGPAPGAQQALALLDFLQDVDL